MTTTRVLHFGDPVTGSSGGLLVPEIDPVMHPSDNGEAERTFVKGTEIYFLIHHGPEIAIVRVTDTAGGDVLRIGQVSRTNTMRLSWAHGDETQELTHLPSAMPTALWYGRTGTLLRDGRTLRIIGAPALADISYLYQAIQYRFRLEEDIAIPADGEWPFELIIETEE